MTDTVTPIPKSSATVASPKVAKTKGLPGLGTLTNVPFGCEHVQAFSKAGDKNWKTFINYYTNIITALRDKPPSILQTYRVAKGEGMPSLKPTFLCMQCPTIFAAEGMRGHWLGAKQHSFFVESRTGHLFCSNCEDFIYDSQLENVRLQKGSKKRSYSEYAYSDTPEDTRLVASNSTAVPCRAIGLRGLYNMGNTCFMSVVLQSLLHNPFLRAFYLSRGHPECKDEAKKERCTSCALDEIFTEFHSAEKTEGYGAVMMLIRSWKSAEHLAGYQQQDAHEYMQFILNSLHTANSRSNDGEAEDGAEDENAANGDRHDKIGSSCTCIIHKTFYGRLQSTVTCSSCRNTTTALDPFMDLSLDLRIQGGGKKRKLNGNNSSSTTESGQEAKSAGNAAAGDVSAAQTSDSMHLDECLRRFTSEERLPAAEYSCAKCGAPSEAVKQLSLRRLPPVLCIHLKRFSHSKDKSSKLETSVSFPLSLDMGPYTTQHRLSRKSATTADSQHQQQQQQSAAAATAAAAPYALSAVIVHKGEINSGHYVSYAREGRDWFLFDDSKVVLVSEGEVLNAQAYLLVYVVESVG